MDSDLVLALALLLVSALFSAAETAFITLSPAKVRTLVEAKLPGAATIAALKQNTHRTLITILVVNNVLNIGAAAITTAVMTERFGSAAIGIATAIVTVIVIVIGEVIPKSIGVSYPRAILKFLGPVLLFIGVLAIPLVWVLDRTVAIIIKTFGGDHQDHVTNEELIALATIGAEEGSIDEQERELIENVLEFNDIQVRDIMTPRVHVSALPESHNLLLASQFLLNEGFSRIPVYRGSIDHVVGIVHARDILKYVLEDKDAQNLTLRQIDLHTPLKVAHSMTIRDLFQQFKAEKSHMAVVLDEHGGTAGIITFEDLLEEIVGDIEDETDKEDMIKRLGENHYELSGRVELDEVALLTDIEFEFPEYKTVSFLMIEKIGRLPKEGQILSFEGWEFRITKMLRHTILKVELKKL